MTGRPARLVLATEDAALTAWNALGVPLVTVSGATTIIRLGDAPDPVAGVLQLAAVLGAIVAVGTRSTRDRGEPGASSFALQMGLIGPFIGAVAFVGGSASTYLGLRLDGLMVALAFVAVSAALAFGNRLPTLPAVLRRILVAPFILVCAGIFEGFAADLLQGMDVSELVAAVTVDQTGFGLFVVGLVLSGLAAFYAALVVAPRVLVDREHDLGWIVWSLRFILFIASAVLGIGWLTLV